MLFISLQVWMAYYENTGGAVFKQASCVWAVAGTDLVLYESEIL